MAYTKEHYESYVGKKFGELTLTKYLGAEDRHHFYEADCTCGKTHPRVNLKYLKTGGTRSCGHLIADASRARMQDPSTIQKIKESLKSLPRCSCGTLLPKGSNPNDPCFHTYNTKKTPDPKPGDRFNEWTVIEETDRKHGNRAWLCRCSCGSVATIGKQHLTKGMSKACKDHKYRTRHGDITGKRFGTLTVVRIYKKKVDGKTYKHAECICDCGRTTHPQVVSLTSGGTAHCALPLCSANGTPSYEAVHHHMSRTRGPAYKQPCIDCGERAHHWSYTHSSPDEHLSEVEPPYSLDIYAYEPRCHTCHHHYDKAHGQIDVNYSR